MPFRKGQSGNPAGRPRGHRHHYDPFRSALIDALRKTDAHGVTRLELAARKLVELAIGGNMAAIKEVGNRLDGVPAQAAYFDDEPRRPLVVVSTVRGGQVIPFPHQSARQASGVQGRTDNGRAISATPVALSQH